MFLEMRNILGMRQVLLGRIRAMEFLKMMDLVLILVVAVMAGPEAKVRQDDAMGAADGVFREGDGAAAVLVEEREHFVDDLLLFRFRHVFGRFIF